MQGTEYTIQLALKKKMAVLVVDFIGSSNWKIRVVETKLSPEAETMSLSLSFSASLWSSFSLQTKYKFWV